MRFPGKGWQCDSIRETDNIIMRIEMASGAGLRMSGRGTSQWSSKGGVNEAVSRSAGRRNNKSKTSKYQIGLGCTVSVLGLFVYTKVRC